jgi:hypothetical protein
VTTPSEKGKNGGDWNSGSCSECNCTLSQYFDCESGILIDVVQLYLISASLSVGKLVASWFVWCRHCVLLATIGVMWRCHTRLKCPYLGSDVLSGPFDCDLTVSPNVARRLRFENEVAAKVVEKVVTASCKSCSLSVGSAVISCNLCGSCKKHDRRKT